MSDQSALSPPQPLIQALEAGEKLIWWGTPKHGIVFRQRDMFLIPFSVLWAGFAFFWEGTATLAHTPLIVKIWGVPFVLMGCYFLIGRFFHDAWRRSRTIYGLTSQRIVIVTSSALKTIELNSIGEMRLENGKSTYGSIVFGPEENWPLSRNFGMWSGRPSAPTFEMIENPKRVFTGIRLAQKQARISLYRSADRG